MCFRNHWVSLADECNEMLNNAIKSSHVIPESRSVIRNLEPLLDSSSRTVEIMFYFRKFVPCERQLELYRMAGYGLIVAWN